MLRSPRSAADAAACPGGHVAARSSGRARAGRGALAASIAVTTAAVAHTAAHQAPSATIVLLALLISLPICIGLAGVRLSRTRLALSVGASQALLHGMFVLPAPRGEADVEHAAHAAHASEAAHAAHAVEPAQHASGHMLPAHVLAALGTYLLLRRGEVLLAALIDLLTLRPARILMRAAGELQIAARRVPIPRTARRPMLLRVDVEPATVRGPPPHPSLPT
ncbi:hypothetical protein GCM10027060_25480 [Nesterenkonia halophila]|uniref:hypothetical protein n=1 Tax=Nesterenkonia halophila TaxID=302044 RepID=UPI001479237A|nr:hypothetical protein [Nesterenkonia halophila]